jgi:hypothetical protein
MGGTRDKLIGYAKAELVSRFVSCGAWAASVRVAVEKFSGFA